MFLRVCAYDWTWQQCLLLFLHGEFRWHHWSNRTQTADTPSLCSVCFSLPGLDLWDATTHLKLNAAGHRWYSYDLLMCVCGTLFQLCPSNTHSCSIRLTLPLLYFDTGFYNFLYICVQQIISCTFFIIFIFTSLNMINSFHDVTNLTWIWHYQGNWINSLLLVVLRVTINN